jgi:hypothetical protein
MRRRDFGSLLGGMAAFTTWSPLLNAQQKATPVIGYLGIATPSVAAPNVAAFRADRSGCLPQQPLSMAPAQGEEAPCSA